MNILVLSARNATRSIFLESIFNTLGKGRIRAFSAGDDPAENITPEARALLARKGHRLEGLHCQNTAAFSKPDAPDFAAVITLSPIAQSAQPAAPLSAHWSVEDPAGIANPAAFEVAYAMLEARAKAWLSLDFERMDKAEQQHHLRRIGEASLVM